MATLLATAPRCDLEGKHVVVVGLGSSGRAAVKLALLRGAASVVAVDKSRDKELSLEADPLLSRHHLDKVRLELGSHQLETFLSASRIVLSPGVPLDEPIVSYAMASAVPVSSELSFAAEVFPKSVRMAAVTGTNGKSTVASFTGQILQKAGLRTFIGGNLGTPLSEAASSCLVFPSDDPPFQAAVVEVSSYQLEHPGDFNPTVGAVLNLTPDHLERHKTMETYAKIKCRLFSQMQPWQISLIPRADAFLRKIASQSPSRSTRAWIGGLPGVQIDSQGRRAIAVVPTTGAEARLYLSSLKTVGLHNAHNAATAAFLALALDVGVDEEQIQSAVGDLTPLPHRMQIVLQDEKGVTWINDSKATNVEAALAGIQGLVDRKAIVLVGGLAKVGGLGFGSMAEALNRHKSVITFGESANKIEQELKAAHLQVPCLRVTTLQDAVCLAQGCSSEGDVVLLSPACASFDEFRNFEHRGETFSKLAASI